jgi:hypothetical protein
VRSSTSIAPSWSIISAARFAPIPLEVTATSTRPRRTASQYLPACSFGKPPILRMSVSGPGVPS